MKNRNIVAIGASAGGVEALGKLFSTLPAGLQASFFVVLHIPSESPSLLATLLDSSGPLVVTAAKDGEPIRPARVYVCPPDYHLLIEPGHIRLHRGPRENRHRPAIDPLFRSAAVAYRTRVVGIVLTGFLDDGSSGLLAIKRCGGVTIAQAPHDAQYPDMPKNAIAAAEPHYQLALDEMGSAIARLACEPAPPEKDVPDDIKMEARIAGQTMSDIRGKNQLGHLVPFSCPECSGPLWQIDADNVRRYRCHVGHGFTAKALLASQDLALEQALWAAMRTMEERANITTTMAQDESERGRSKSAKVFEERAKIAKNHAQVIRRLLTDKEL